MYKELFEKHIKGYLKNIKENEDKTGISYSGFEDYQYQTSVCLSNKKINPLELKKYLEIHHDDYEKIEVTGKGYLSVKFKVKAFENKLKENKQKIIVDYCGVNVAKQMHIGHIRSMFIGDYIVRLHQSLGDDVTIFNHIGDWGNQFGFLIAYIEENNLENSLTNKTLTEYYKLAYELFNNDEEFNKKAGVVAQKLQSYDKKYLKIWKKMVELSMEQAEKTFAELGLLINKTHTQGESFYAPYCKEIIQKLLEMNIAKQEPDGSVVVLFENKSPLILQKSNGNYLYALYDLTAIWWREKYVNPDKIIYVVDKRQALHFEQVFDVAYSAGFVKKSTKLMHVGFGTILGEDKKPLKTKEGKSLYLDDLFEEGKNILLQDVRYNEMSEEIKNEILQKTIVGGMKFYDLKFNKNQDYIFDWKNVLNFTGNSAPYIQNALVRIDSILYKKYGLNQVSNELLFSENFTNIEADLIFNCQKLNELILENANLYQSQLLTEQTIKICQLFHRFYEEEKVLGGNEEDKKITIILFVQKTLNNVNSILGIESYNCMEKNKVLKNKM